MATTILEFPFDSGAYEAADFTWLPPNLFSAVENMRLDLDGRLAVRPGNTQLGNSVFQGGGRTLVAYDLANYAGRLVALGDVNGDGFPSDLYEFLGSSNGAVWRPTSQELITGRMPRATNARDIGRVPDMSSGVDNVQVAAGAGHVCMVLNLTNGTECIVHVFDPTDDQTVLLARLDLYTARVVFAGSDFWIVGQNPTTDDIVRYNFDPLTDTALAGPSTISTAPAGDVQDIAACTFGASDWVVVWAQSTTTTAHRLNSSGVVQATFSVAGGDFRALAAAGNSAGTLINILAQRGADGTYRLNTYNAAGVLQTGPTTPFGGAAGTVHTRAGMCVSGIGTSVILVGFEDNAVIKNTLVQEAVMSSHAVGSVVRYRDSLPSAAPICPVGGIARFCGAINYLAGNDARGTNQFIETNPSVVPICMKDGTLGGRITFRNDMCGTAAIGSKVYWGNTVQSNTGGNGGIVTELELTDTGRRQMAVIGNELHIAGALPLVYDGRLLVESGFAERPVCQLTAGTTGALTALGRYNVRVVWETIDGRGHIVRSQASSPVELTLAGAEDSITVVASTPHSLRLRDTPGTNEVRPSVRVGVYRTIAGGSNFILDSFIEIPSTHLLGNTVTTTLVKTDAQLVAGGVVLYEQSQTPLAHVAPQPYRYTWPARERQLVGGLPAAEAFQYSKLLFPSEPVEFATPGRLGFSGRANKEITAVGAFETVGIIWTSDEILIVPGRGPEHSGIGEFDATVTVPAPGGCSDWRSLVSAPPGFFFQMQGEKLMLLARGQQGAGEVSWVGQPVRQTLAAFPVITGAVHIRSQMAVVFSCTDTGGTAGRLLVFDLRRQVWYVDTVGPVSAVSELGGRLAYISGGNVFLQDAAAGSGTFPGGLVTTAYIPVTERLGWGQLHRLGLIVLASGACSVQCLLDVDDGVGYRDLGTEAFTATGRREERFWSIPTAARKLARFSARFVLSSGSPSVGVKLIAWAAEVQGSPNMVRVGSGGVVQ